MSYFLQVVLAMEHHQQSDGWTIALDVLNIFFICLYGIEFFIKIVGLGLKKHFVNAWNIFDLVVLALAIGHLFVPRDIKWQYHLFRPLVLKSVSRFIYTFTILVH